jgi:outer membrane protein insertion porin family
MRVSKENFERLCFFDKDSVEFITSSPPGRPDIMDVDIGVKERPTGQFQLGAGYGTASKFFFTTQVAETNFRGLGQDLRFTAQMSADRRTRSFTLGFTDPYAFDTTWSAGGDVFFTASPYPDRFTQYRRGANLRVGYPLTDYTRLYFGYKFERFKHEEIRDPFIRQDIDRENGLSSSVSATIVTDKRNNRMEPTKGYYLSLGEEFAGLGGNRNFVRSIFDARYYKNLFGDLVLRTKFEAGNIFATDSKRIQSAERFYLGGPNSLKGYDSFSVGPSRKTTDPLRNNALVEVNEGGTNQLFYILEFEHPLIKEVGLKLVVFYDVGEAWSSDSGDNFRLHQDFGWGVRWFSPLGPLRFEWGYPINPKGRTPQGSNFQFMIGPPF